MLNLFILISKLKKSYVVEYLVFFLYSVSLVIIMFFHEPWFDEAQSWLIARDASVIELITSITHYEGHPPVWVLILMPFAKSGFRFEIALKFINFIFISSSINLIIFKAPFNRLIRLTIPFTYFFFYQYGVISRVYSFMLLGFILCAIFFSSKNSKPYRFVCSLAILCSASAYGIIISFGITLVWAWENFVHYIKSRNFINKKIIYSMIVLLLLNIWYIFLITPYHDTYAIVFSKHNSKLFMLFYMFLIAPADAILTGDFYNYTENINNYQIFIAIMSSCIIHYTLIILTKKNKLLSLYIITYSLFAIFSATIYFWYHHLGIITMYFLFIMWICAINDNKLNFIIDLRIQKFIFKPLLCLSIGISISWTFVASYNEVKLNYGTGREVSKYLIENNLYSMNIMIPWEQIQTDSGKLINDYNHLYIYSIPTLAYFDRNIVFNLNEGNNKSYLTHKVNYGGIKNYNILNNITPDILIDNNNKKYTFGNNVFMSDYDLIKTFKGNTIWKNRTVEYKQNIYIRKVLLKNNYQLIQVNN